jgi:hypothetical protein
MGGGFRLDVRINLIALGSSAAFQCQCHTEVHAGTISRADLLLIVAQREGVLQGEIETEIYRLRREPKK